MVLGGQDAWRNHPLLSGNHKKAIPNVGLAVGIFVGLVAVDWMYKQVSGGDHHHGGGGKISVTYVDESFDTTPSAEIKRGGGHGHH